MQTRKCVGANEFELLFEEVFNLLRPTLYPREWNFWTISEMEEEVMILCRGSRVLWVRARVGSETFRWRVWQPSKDWHKRRDAEVFRVWGDGNLRAAGKCWPVLLMLFFYVSSFLFFVLPLLLLLHVWLLLSCSSPEFSSHFFSHIIQIVFMCCWSIILTQFSPLLNFKR